jgi:UDP-2-acetamido-3-amino-2,3-dideoxy-glucuronate N-acetyltransferase
MKDQRFYVHPQGMCDSEQVGEGSRIWAFAHVMSGAILGKNVNIGECSFIEGGAVLGNNCTVKNHVAVWNKVVCEDYVFLGPSAVFTNDLTPRCEFKKDPETDYYPTLIKKGASIGANAVVVCGTTLGEYCMIGSGAVVTKDVPDFGLIYGNPGRLKGYSCRCGLPLKNPAHCSSCGRKYRWKNPDYSGEGLNPYGLAEIE